MRSILTLLLCVMLICAILFTVSADDSTPNNWPGRPQHHKQCVFMSADARIIQDQRNKFDSDIQHFVFNIMKIINDNTISAEKGKFIISTAEIVYKSFEANVDKDVIMDAIYQTCINHPEMIPYQKGIPEHERKY